MIEIVREIGRSERIRTSDPLLPKQVRYQAALRSDRERGLQGGGGLGKGGGAEILHELTRGGMARATVRTTGRVP